MSALALQIGAQVGAEVRTRLRSVGTLVALATILLGAYVWIPAPGGKATSVSWQLADGRLRTSVHSAAYIGAAMSFLGGFLAIAVGFYLVAGSIRRDRERRIGAILAATPLPSAAYLLGKYFAHVAYLSLVVLCIVPIGLYHFLRFGVGPFDPVAFLGPIFLLALPGIAFVAAMAVLFDVAPGLSGRIGWVIWFILLGVIVGALPIAQAQNPSTGFNDRLPLFDPMGGATVSVLIARSLPQAKLGSISTGHIVHREVIPAVAWSGLPLDADFVTLRLAGILWAVPPLALALLLFDRFDPARRRLKLRRKAKPVPSFEAQALLDPQATAAALSGPSFAKLAPVTPHLSAFLAIAADAVLLWKTGSILRWAVVILVILAAVLPASAAPMVGAGFLLLLATLISEASCRESLAGAESLVFSQPGVPRSGVLWKLGSVGLFVVVVSLPFLLRALFTSPAQGFAALSGLLFVTALAVSFGILSGGGKLFVGIYLALWYAALNRVPYLDFCGLFGGDLGLPVRLAYLGAGAIFVALAMVVESRRRATGSR